MNESEEVLFKQAIQEHYQQQSLEPSQMAFLREKIEFHPSMTKGVNAREKLERNRGFAWWFSSWGRWGVPTYAGVLCVLFVWLFSGNSPSYLARAANEIAKNHKKHSSLQIFSARLSLIQKKLPRLKFQALASNKMPLSSWKLEGGRYCSVQGTLAIQLRYQYKRQSFTLYQIPLPSELRNMKKTVFHTKGSYVVIWPENDLLLGLAGPLLPKL